jgi:hypothetical protein
VNDGQKAARTIGRIAILRALKDRANAWRPKDFSSLATAVNNETDRGAVIIVATLLDDLLATHLQNKMVKLNSEEEDKLFGPDRPLGSFSARIRMAYALGIIDRPAAKKLDILREIRNACAHGRHELSFDTPEF